MEASVPARMPGLPPASFIFSVRRRVRSLHRKSHRKGVVRRNAYGCGIAIEHSGLRKQRAVRQGCHAHPVVRTLHAFGQVEYGERIAAGSKDLRTGEIGRGNARVVVLHLHVVVAGIAGVAARRLRRDAACCRKCRRARRRQTPPTGQATQDMIFENIGFFISSSVTVRCFSEIVQQGNAQARLMPQ